jgi:hypothetical protein
VLDQSIADHQLIDAVHDRTGLFDRGGQSLKIDLVSLDADVRADGLGIDLGDRHIGRLNSWHCVESLGHRHDAGTLDCPVDI